MSVLYTSKADSLTPQNIVDSYRSAYYAVHGDYPDECWHLQGRWFIINGVERDRYLVLLEIDRLRQEALEQFEPEQEKTPRGPLMRLIRRLASF